MNHSRELNNKINEIPKQVLRLVYRDKKPTFDELLDNGNSVKVHIKNLQVLVTEMFKMQNETSPAIISRTLQSKTILSETTLLLYLAV